MLRFNKRFLLIVFLVFGIFNAVSGETVLASEKKDTRARIFVETVAKSRVTETAPVIGRFVALQRGAVAARVRGTVAEVLVDVGTRVKAQEVLAKLDVSRLDTAKLINEARLKEADGSLRAARAQLKLIGEELRRNKKLRGSAAFSRARLIDKRNEYTKFESEVAEKEAAVSSAKANLRMAEIDLNYANIRAPYDGVVAERHVSLGNFVRVGDAVVTLVNDADLEVEVNVPQSRLKGIVPGTKVTIRFGNGLFSEAVVRAIVPEEDPSTRTRSVRLVPDINDRFTNGSLAANQSVTIDVPIAQSKDMTTVHKDAIIVSGQSYFVYVIKDGKAWRRNINLGQAVADRFVIISGLKDGEIVATRGNEKLKPGKKIKIVEK
ncbi:MAG: efflux RND transporter periplasmic adaptor subunit [Pseudomonadota bacterium]|nr:efflux RND transporter periplasmic adaptor subunit [Pseudomonadota bacterium]